MEKGGGCGIIFGMDQSAYSQTKSVGGRGGDHQLSTHKAGRRSDNTPSLLCPNKKRVGQCLTQLRDRKQYTTCQYYCKVRVRERESHEVAIPG